MKSLLSKGWSLMRVLRLATGIAGLVYAVIGQELLIGIAGLFLILMGLFNTGCCSAGSCSIPKQPHSR